MSRPYASTKNAIEGLVSSLSLDEYSPKTRRFYRDQCRLAVAYLPEGKTLYQVTPDDVRGAVAGMRTRGLAVSTIKDYVHALQRLLKFIGNYEAGTVHIVHQADVRPNVNWLTPEQAKTVFNAPMNPAQRLAIVLALGMGLRRVEIIRLKLEDVNVQRGYVTVTGKGRGGGKLRLVPFHPRFNEALGEWLKVRHQMVGRGWNPEALLIWERGGVCSPYSDVKATGIEALIKRVSRACGVPFSFHTLRRTFGRIMWLSGVSVVTIARMLGHTSTEQTLAYIGANLDDMAGAMNVFSLQ